MSQAATHAFCPRCNRFEPVIWSQITIAEIHISGDIGEFEGLEMKCRSCQFEITKVGICRQRKMIEA